jgi:hypothetical protein
VSAELQRIARQQENLLELFESFSVSARKTLQSLEERMTTVEQRVESMYSSRPEYAASVTGTSSQAHSALGSPTQSAGHSRAASITGATLDAGSHSTHWKAAISFLDAGDINNAFKSVLQSNDATQLIRLMGRTGPVLDNLDRPVRDAILGRVANFVTDGVFLDSVLPWVQQMTTLSESAAFTPVSGTTQSNSILSQLGVEPSTATKLMEALHILSVRPNAHGILASRLLAEMHQMK